MAQTSSTTSTARATRICLPAFAAAALFAAAGCAVGPDYKKPATPVASTYKEAAPDWKTAAPNDAADRGTWWEAFNDPILNDLENQAATANQSLLIAVANYEQSRQSARADRATFFPSISGSASAQRAKSASRNGIPGSITNSYSAGLNGSWTLDFWGRIRREVEADLASAQASAANLANARLSMQTTLATTYIQLRVADERVRLRQNAVEAYRRTLSIAQNKYNVGVVARSDVISAQAQLDAARAQVVDASVQRAQFEHAIAVLVGKAPGDFTIDAQPTLGFAVPAVPSQIPSQLLERRPDIAAAERTVAAANARIGVQIAAYFPDISLSAAGGFSSSTLSKLFNAANRSWSIGAAASDTILDFGRRGAEVAIARAAYDGQVATYRRTVLEAFQDVEDNLSGLRLLATEADIQTNAVNEASEAARITLNEYNAGTVDFTTVVNAQVTELNDRQSALTILQERLVDSVTLIEALGGGWKTSDLPTDSQVYSDKAMVTTAAVGSGNGNTATK